MTKVIPIMDALKAEKKVLEEELKIMKDKEEEERQRKMRELVSVKVCFWSKN